MPAQYRYEDGSALLVADSLFVRLRPSSTRPAAPMWTAGMSGGAPDRVLGMPVFTHPNLAAIGANSKSAIVGNFRRGYIIRQVNGVFMQRQNELHSDNGQVGFRAYTRLDGRVASRTRSASSPFAAT